MASGGQDHARLISALQTMQLQVDAKQKMEAHHFLEEFQKSKDAWHTTHELLRDASIPADVRLFAATTFKGKIVYDLDELPRTALAPLRDSILALLAEYHGGPRPIRTQLCLCLANLAIQFLDWKDIIPLVGSSLGEDCIETIVEFLTVLPEEIAEGRKINLSEDELSIRSKELLEDNASKVLDLLVGLSNSQASSKSQTGLLKCVTSWLREIPVASIVQSPLLEQCIMKSLASSADFEASVECLCAIFHDTRDVDESLNLIQIIYPHLIALRPRIAQAANSDDEDILKGLTRLFAEAGEQWVVLIARLPQEFLGLVNAISECCSLDKEYEALSQTFIFWYELKQMLVLEKYQTAHIIYAKTYNDLVEILIERLRFPTPEDGDDGVDPFDGDREQEERFRETRHHMGDVLKDCCEITSPSDCLQKPLVQIQNWLTAKSSASGSTADRRWQVLESALFAMRAMGRMVSPEESTILPLAIPLIVQVPQHEKLLFQALMALGRYTEWTSQHPEFLQMQLDFVMACFKYRSKEVVRAAALAFRFFGIDCRQLLSTHVYQLHAFYESVLDDLTAASQEEITEGVAAVVSAQPSEAIHMSLKTFCDPIMNRIMSLANAAKLKHDEAANLAIADQLQLLTIFIQQVRPYVGPEAENPAVTYFQEILPILFAVAENFTSCIPVLERLCRCWRAMVLSYRTATLPILPALATQLAQGFENSRQGCFLWATDAVLREFASGADYVTSSTSQSIWQFFERQATAFLRIMNNSAAQDLPDLVEDFFRLLIDALIYYHNDVLDATICPSLIMAATSALCLENEPPLTAVLHFVLDFCSYGTDHPNSSTLRSDSAAQHEGRSNQDLQLKTKHILDLHGKLLLERILFGMMSSFPPDCIPTSSAIVMVLFEIMPEKAAAWLQSSIDSLPTGSIRLSDAQNLVRNVTSRVHDGETRKLRAVLQDFTSAYRRRNVAPREGLAFLPAPKFTFSG